MSREAAEFVLWQLHQAPDGTPLSYRDRLILMALAVRYHERRRCAWPSMESIAKAAGVSAREVRRRLRWLQEAGVIVCEARFKRDPATGRIARWPNDYQIVPYEQAKDRELIRSVSNRQD